MSIEMSPSTNQHDSSKKSTLEVVTETLGGRQIADALANTRLASYLYHECDQWKGPEILAAVAGIIRVLEQNGLEIRQTNQQNKS